MPHEFILVCPNEKPSWCLKDFRKFSVKEIQEILKHYSLNSCHQMRLWIVLLIALIKLFFLVNFQMKFGKMKLEKYGILIFSGIPLFVVITRTYNSDLLRKTSYKRLKLFQFLYEGHIKTMELCTT